MKRFDATNFLLSSWHFRKTLFENTTERNNLSTPTTISTFRKSSQQFPTNCQGRKRHRFNHDVTLFRSISGRDIVRLRSTRPQWLHHYAFNCTKDIINDYICGTVKTLSETIPLKELPRRQSEDINKSMTMVYWKDDPERKDWEKEKI